MSDDKDIDNCRECGHFRFLHIIRFDGSYDSKTGNYTQGFSQHCDPQTDHGCDCSEFVPEDNLDYVEWLARKRGLIK